MEHEAKARAEARKGKRRSNYPRMRQEAVDAGIMNTDTKHLPLVKRARQAWHMYCGLRAREQAHKAAARAASFGYALDEDEAAQIVLFIERVKRDHNAFFVDAITE